MLLLVEMLRRSIWASCLSPKEIVRVAQEASERRVAAGGLIVRMGEPADHWIGIIEGLVKMSVTAPDGRASSFTAVTTGGWFGEGSLLKKGERWRYEGIALRNTRLACIPRTTFERLLATSLAFNRFLLNHLNARLSLFISLAEIDRLLGPDARVARCLASLFDPDLYPHTDPLLQLTQDEIGLLSAMSRQRANRAVHALEKAGLAKIEFKGIRVLDIEGLRRYSGVAEARHVLKRRSTSPAASGSRPAPAGVPVRK